jgi:uncharacterized protein YecE (DUF72 family)
LPQPAKRLSTTVANRIVLLRVIAWLGMTILGLGDWIEQRRQSVAQLGMIASAANQKVYLGCPVWAHAPWRGSLFAKATKSADFLASYAQFFNAVEGNSTFYALPSTAQIANWRAAVPDSFRFCLKFPRQISHDLKLQHATRETQEFLQRIAPLGARLGPLLLQLGPSFAPVDLPILDQFLDAISRDFAVCVEVRHPLFFYNQNHTPSNFSQFEEVLPAEMALNALLARHGSHRCHFDTQCVHRSLETDASTLEAQRRKPKLPRRTQVVGTRTMLRIVGQNKLLDTEADISVWASNLCQLLVQNNAPEIYAFTHTPDDLYAPQMAQALYRAMRAQLPQLAELPLLSRQLGSDMETIMRVEQLGLF